MLVSLEWLKSYVDVTLPVAELAHRLTMVGLEVEGVRSLCPVSERVVTGRVLSVDPHPGADRLTVCRVEAASAVYRVVCGATNVTAGAVVPLALAGAELPGGMTIQETHIRGEHSQGMLCSQRELGLGEDCSGIWILPPETPVGLPLSKALQLEDHLLEVAVTPNRGDCLSILGIAREVAAIEGRPLKVPKVQVVEDGPAVETLSSISVLDTELCPRYAARIIEGITVGPSPPWLRRNIESVGLRSINNIVDVTNFILMELGQPLHAFDFDRLRENRIVVRRASADERFVTLDGVERTLHDDTLLICDGIGPVAIAGIMGGLNSEITQDTRRVLIESAYFQPQSTRRTSKKLGLRTESSYRFERGVDPEGLVRALDRAAQLMQEVGGGRIARGRLDVYPHPMVSPVLTLDVDRTNRFLGTALTSGEMADALRSIELGVEEVNQAQLRVAVPSFRPDITRAVDLMEEVARLIGYDRIPVTAPVASIETEPPSDHLLMRQELKEILEGAGFFEVLTYSFVGQDALQRLGFAPDDPRLHPIPVMNPISEDQGVMRTTLMAGLLQTACHNFNRGNEDLRIFELGKVFLPRTGEALPEEPHHLAGLMSGRRCPQLLYDRQGEVAYEDVKGVVEAVLEPFHARSLEFLNEPLPPYLDPSHGASVFLEGCCVGFLGTLHQDVAKAFDLDREILVFELDFEQCYAHRRPLPLFRGLPRFPSVSRDIALILEEGVPIQSPVNFIRDLQEPLLAQVEVFDLYRSPQLGENKKSVGYRLVYRSGDRSLTDAEVNRIHEGIVQKVLDHFAASLRC